MPKYNDKSPLIRASDTRKNAASLRIYTTLAQSATRIPLPAAAP